MKTSSPWFLGPGKCSNDGLLLLSANGTSHTQVPKFYFSLQKCPWADRWPVSRHRLLGRGAEPSSAFWDQSFGCGARCLCVVLEAGFLFSPPPLHPSLPHPTPPHPTSLPFLPGTAVLWSVSFGSRQPRNRVGCQGMRKASQN